MSNNLPRFYGVEIRGGVQRYIQFYYLIPRDLPKEYWKKEWLDAHGNLKQYGRIRFKDGINRANNPLTDEQRLQSVIDALAGGLNPFDEIMQRLRELNHAKPEDAILIPISKKTGISFKDALEKYIDNYTELVISDGEEVKNPTWEHASGTKRMLEEYFANRLNAPAAEITSDDLESMLKHYEKARQWKKSSYNDRMRKIKTVFRFFMKKKLITEDPSAYLDGKTKVARTRHEYFDKDTSDRIFNAIASHPDKKVAKSAYYFYNAIYYTCTRPVKETRRLRCGDILWKDNLVDINSGRAKGGSGGYIPLAPELATLFKEMGVDKYPPEYFIFGNEFKPGPICFEEEDFYTDWFRTEIREPIGLDEKYTPYGFKHTRIRDLYHGSATIQQIQVFCRHASPTDTEKYLKKLGCLVDQSINTKSSRKL